MKEEKTNNYYAYIIDSNGLKKEFEVSESGILNIGNKNLKGILFSNATEVYCYNNQLSSLDLPNATSVSCHNNQLSSLDLPNATFVSCKNNQLSSLDLPNATEVYCYNNQLSSLDLPNATFVSCENNQLSSLDLPNATSVSCHNNQLSSLVNNCGIHNRTIWSQKIKGKIYTYIGCGRFTLEEAKVAILKKYPRDKAETYIEKVKLSQSLVN